MSVRHGVFLRTRDGEYLRDLGDVEWGPKYLPGPLEEATLFDCRPSEEYWLRRVEREWSDDPRALTRIPATVKTTRKIVLKP